MIHNSRKFLTTKITLWFGIATTRGTALNMVASLGRLKVTVLDDLLKNVLLAEVHLCTSPLHLDGLTLK